MPRGILSPARVVTGNRLLDAIQDAPAKMGRFFARAPWIEGVLLDGGDNDGSGPGLSIGVTPTTIAHGLGRRPRGFAIIDAQATGDGPELATNVDQGVCTRAKSVGAFGHTTTVCVGTRWWLASARQIVGVRFLWTSTGANPTVKARLYRDSDGASLRDASVVVGETGFYEARWSSPLSYATLTDFTVACYCASGNGYNTDTAWQAIVPIRTGPDLLLRDQALFANADAIPTGAAAGGTYCLEPILAGVPTISRTTSSDPTKTLALIASAPCTAKVWVW